MTGALKDFAKAHWPQLRLRTILMLTLLLVAGLPGVGAISLRVYENTLVRQTEAELIAQGAALAATAEALWPGAPRRVLTARLVFRPEPASMDLSASPMLAERPPAAASRIAPDRDALAVGASLFPIARQTAETTLASIELADRHGTIVLGHDFGRSHATLPEFRRALAGTPATVFRRNDDYRPRYAFEWLSRASALRIHHVRPVTVGGRTVAVLLLSRSPRALFKGLYQDRAKILLGMAAIFVALLGITALLSRGIARPIEQLGLATRRLAAGDGDIPDAPVTAAIEIRALYEDFAAMAEAVSRRSRYLSDFAAAVSHEFKTPLAGITGGIELLQDHDMAEPDRRRFLANIAADAERLAQLVTRLLDLARADMAEPQAGASSDPLAATRRIADAFRGPTFAVEIGFDAAPVVAVPQATLEAALTTLFENARQAGATRVTVSAKIDRAHLTLLVTDDGPGIPPADAPRLFELFFTSRRETGGTGLGLPIARSLLKANGGDIELRTSDAGATFALRLPLAR